MSACSSGLTPQQLQDAGFVPCPQWPCGLPQERGSLYVCHLPQGPAYVLCPDDTDEIHAFVGEWLNPRVYFSMVASDARQLLRLLS